MGWHGSCSSVSTQAEKPRFFGRANEGPEVETSIEMNDSRWICSPLRKHSAIRASRRGGAIQQCRLAVATRMAKCGDDCIRGVLWI